MNTYLGLIFLAAATSAPVSVAAQSPTPSAQEERTVDIILYDEDTIRRLNQIQGDTSPQTHQGDVMSEPKPTREAIRDSMPVEMPKTSSTATIETARVKDVSTFFSRQIRGVNVIDNPPSCADWKPGIDVTTFNPDKVRGKIVLDLHNHIEEDFLEVDKIVFRVIVLVEAEETRFCIPLSDPGNYAFALYHDKNGNEKWDKNFLGIPKERFGVSNNPKYGMSAPAFEDAVISVPAEGLTQRIRLTSSSEVLAGNKN